MSRRRTRASWPLRLLAAWATVLPTVAVAAAHLGAQQAGAVADPTAAPLDPTLAAALQDKARGRDAAGAAALLTYATRLCADSAASTSDRIAAEGSVAMALGLCERAPVDAPQPIQMLALRDSPLGRSDAALADQIGMLVLSHLRDDGSIDAPPLARELGYLDDFWICGPFDNERGSALARELPPETGFDANATWPGKLRPVGWRRLTGVAADGMLRLGAVLRPADQTACLVAVALQSDRDRTVALHLGSAGSYQVRLHGRALASRDVDRPFAADQDAVALPLTTGANLLTIKFCHQETGEFAVSLRLAAADGGPMSGVAVAADPAALADAAAASATAAPAAALPAPSQGARSLRSVEAAHGLDALWLATLWALRSADAEAQRRDRTLAERAAADLPDLTHARLVLAATRIRNARVAAELDENERRVDYETVLTRDPQNVEAAWLLAQLLMQGTGLRQEAERLAQQALAVCPDCPTAALLRIDVLRARGQDDLARRELSRAAALPTAPPAVLRTAHRWASGSNGDQDALVDRLLAASGLTDDRLLAIDHLLRRGRRDAAVEALAALQRRDPLSRRAYQVRAELAEAELDFDTALAQYDAWLRLCPDDDDALAAQARLHGRLGHQDQQVEALRAAIECNPNRRDDQRYLEYLAAETTPFHAAWTIDATPLLTVPTPEAATVGKDPVFHLLRQRVVLAHKNGTTSEYLHHCVRILNDAGARAWSNFRLPYYYGEQRARLLSCTVHKADGTKEQPRLRGASVALPSLQPGDVVDLEGRIDDSAPTFFGDYFGLMHFLSAPDGAAVHRSDLVVLAEPGRDYRYQLANGAPAPVEGTTDTGAHSYAFRLDDLPRDIPEPNRPDAKERGPLVRFTTFRDWDHFASWWWNLIKGQIETTPAMRSKVRELTADCTNTEQRIAAIYRFVTTDVRYEAWEFGVHGYKPYSTSVIYERRHGDCKDKALLLCALLGEIGVRADPVLILADQQRSKDDLELPMVQHFNHCIAWMPAQDGRQEHFLDGTAIWHPPATTPDMDQGADVLVVDAGKALLRTVPYVDAAANCDQVRFEIELLPDGTARARQIEQPTGNEAVPMRQALAVEPARRRDHVERNLVPMFGPVEIRDLECADPLDYAAPVQLTVDFDIKALGQRSAGEWQLPSAFGDDPLTDLTAEPERISPLLLGVPRRDARVLTYRLPAGFTVGSLPATVQRSGPFGDVSVVWRRQGDQVVVERTVTITTARIEPGDYPAFRDLVTALRTADAQRIVLQKEGGR